MRKLTRAWRDLTGQKVPNMGTATVTAIVTHADGTVDTVHLGTQRIEMTPGLNDALATAAEEERTDG